MGLDQVSQKVAIDTDDSTADTVAFKPPDNPHVANSILSVRISHYDWVRLGSPQKMFASVHRGSS